MTPRGLSRNELFIEVVYCGVENFGLLARGVIDNDR